MKSIKDHCGIFGIFNMPDAARLTYFGLHALQHRGQESCGIVSSSYDSERQRKIMTAVRDFGLVLDVFDDPSLFQRTLKGSAAIGHTRYSTSGSSVNRANIQPFHVRYRDGNLTIAHNGNLSNASTLRRMFSEQGILFQSTSDTELILHLISQSRETNQLDQILDALSQVKGGYALALLTDDSLIAVRDPNGFRPLSIGKIQQPNDNGTQSYCIASETCAFDLIGAEYIRDVEPGEVIIINQESTESGTLHSRRLHRKNPVSQCVFEYIYFSRPDSLIYGEMVDKIRRKFGKQLAHDAPVPRVATEEKAPLVISVPDSSNTATLGFVSECQKLGYRCKYDIGLIRNHYVGRTFIAPGQDSREMRVRCKFNTVDGLLKDRIVVVVDDSIVRGTTAKLLVKMIRDAGAKEVHFRVASPTVISPCFYGMDFPSKDELLSSQFNDVNEIGKWLGVDSLAYLSIQSLKKAVSSAHDSPYGYCDACFTGNYPVPVDTCVSKDAYD
ncbi:MAG: amidophosphoribosyltransferase [Bacteroidetes bacterium]|nr:amidophosphoribosyltransferase [Bacteroidota bacterium]